MTPIPPIGPIQSLIPFEPAAQATDAITNGASRVGAVAGIDGASPDFASALANGFDAVSASQNHANQLAVQAATGQLDNPAELTIATTKAQLMTRTAVAIETKAVNAFKTIMSLRA